MSDFENVSPRPPIGPDYLGDGVYASFDGYQIWLHVGRHDNPAVVAIEPGMYNRLRQYARSAGGFE